MRLFVCLTNNPDYGEVPSTWNKVLLKRTLRSFTCLCDLRLRIRQAIWVFNPRYTDHPSIDYKLRNNLTGVSRFAVLPLKKVSVSIVHHLVCPLFQRFRHGTKRKMDMKRTARDLRRTLLADPRERIQRAEDDAES